VYDSGEDPYCYRGTVVLRNRLGLRDQDRLDAFEVDLVTQRLSEPLPVGHFSISHYCAVHRHLFGDVYPWAGAFRRVRISKAGRMFCYPENIKGELRRIFGWLHANNVLHLQERGTFAAGLAHFIAELNAVHPFRDGNGRVQVTFAALLADAAGHSLKFTKLDPHVFLNAMIESFRGGEEQLRSVLSDMMD
jgi:cell filamentation protein